MDVIKLPESFAHEVRSMTAYVTDVDHHVARQFPLDLEPQLSIIGSWEGGVKNWSSPIPISGSFRWAGNELGRGG